jgi:metallophosphoesterase superfamily enzyme
MTLIRGNHDILDPSNFREADLRVENELKIGPFLLSHDREETALYNLHGHIHPCVKLRGKGRQSIKSPCYFFSDCFGILPSFGDFTGSHALKPKKSDRVYIPMEDEVFALT